MPFANDMFLVTEQYPRWINCVGYNVGRFIVTDVWPRLIHVPRVLGNLIAMSTMNRLASVVEP